MSAPKVVRAAQNLVINQFMTREAISSIAYKPAEPQVAQEAVKPQNIRIYDETTHLKFGFPKTEKTPMPNIDDNLKNSKLQH